jgi:carbamoylphosphate synthase small subunit
MLYKLNYLGAKSLEEADFVLFTGGEDVHPSFYGEGVLNCTNSNIERDRREAVIYNECVERGIPMVGICRGGQFLNVMNNGKMWQNVDNHCGNHGMIEVLPKTSKKKPRTMLVTSTHHQMMIPDKTGQIIAVGIQGDGKTIAKSWLSFGKEIACDDPKKMTDVEVVYYSKTRSLCFQPHPEFPDAPHDCTEYFDELLEDLILPYSK